MPEPTVISCRDLDTAISEYKQAGYRLDMIFPADNPREALLSEPPAEAGGLTPGTVQKKQKQLLLKLTKPQPLITAGATDPDAIRSEWILGRAGMEYRDLIPGRMGGKVIASHIRLTAGGEVPDYVHYHKINFQMIYCLKGRIKVVYEDQGEPFWMEPGDCVVQPPEIRHRVLESTAGAEVIEVSMPAEHETWVDHETELPTGEIDRGRFFGGQRFVFSRASEAKWELSGFSKFDDAASGPSVNIQLFRERSAQYTGGTNAVCEPGKGIMICMEDGGSILLDGLN